MRLLARIVVATVLAPARLDGRALSASPSVEPDRPTIEAAEALLPPS